MKNKYYSHDSSDDDVPVKLLKDNNGKSKKRLDQMKELCKYSQEMCGFCKKLFFNRYDILVHNTKHMIVSLNRLTYQCSYCLKEFPDEKVLGIHKMKHHSVPDILKSMVNKKPIVKCDNTVTELIQMRNSQLEDIVNSNILIQCDDTVTDLLRQRDEKRLEKIISKEIAMERENTERFKERQLKEDLGSDGSSHSDDLIENDEAIPSENLINSENKINIKSRIMFEEEIDDFEDDIITFNENYENIDLTLDEDDNVDGVREKETEQLQVKIIVGSKVAEEKVPEKNPLSIHYDELLIPGRHECKVCNVTFNNRLKCIMHEATHLQFKRLNRKPPLCTICDKYIAGNYHNLRKHIKIKHGNEMKKKHNIKDCKTCGLKYRNIFKHTYNYHLIYVCPLCEIRFDQESERDKHTASCKPIEERRNENVFIDSRLEATTTLKVCEVCALFMKNRQNYKYVMLGDYSKNGERITCGRCEKKFFEVKLVKMTTKQRIDYSRADNKKKPISNESRLKNIQHRLKMIKKLRKY